jgi:serine phosphatase RsbU (regulator of sigma subunit)
MWKTAPPNLRDYVFHGCNRAGRRPSHEIGCIKLSEDILALWAIRTNSPDGRSKLIDELHQALSTAAPDAVLKALNDGLCEAHPPASHSAEVSVMVLNRSNHTLAITAAGDFLPHLRTPDDNNGQLDHSKTGVPLGLIPSMEYTTQLIELVPTTTVIWVSPYTTQNLNASGEMYNRYRILDQLKALPPEPTLMIDWITNDIETFIGNRDQCEDICVVCFQRID